MTSEKSKKSDWWMVGFTASLVVVTGILAYYTFGLVKYSQYQFGEIKWQDSVNFKNSITSDSLTRVSLAYADSSFKVSKDGFTIAKQSLAISNKSAKFYKESIQIENRAYIRVPEIKFTGNGKDSSIQIQVLIENIGKTPAYSVKSFFYYRLDNKEIWFNDIEKIVSKKRNAITSDSTILTMMSGQATMGNIDINIQEGNLIRKSIYLTDYKIYVFGYVHYTDVFGNTHFVHILNRYIPKEGFEGCSIYNDAD